MGNPKRKARKLSGPAAPTTATRMEYHPSSLGNGATPRLSRMAKPDESARKSIPAISSSSLFWL